MSLSNWKMSTLGEACLNITDGSHTSPPSVENGYYMASVKDMDLYGFDFNNCRMISEVDYTKLVRNGCKPHFGDVLVGKDGARYLEDAFVFKQNKEVVLLSSIAILRPDKRKVTSEYLYYFLRNENTRIDIKNNYGSGSAIPRMVLKDFKRVPIPVPALSEQKAIADTLSCLDDKIELNNRINKTLEEMAQAIFKSWFVDFEPFQDGEFEDSELGQIPKGWRVGTVEEFAEEMKNGGTPSRKNETYWNSNDIPWIKTGEIKNSMIIKSEEFISHEGLRNSSAKMLPYNSVLMAMYGATAGQIGLLRFEATTNQACCAMICSSSNKSIFLYLNLLNNQEYIKSLAVGAAQQNLSKDTISKLKIIIPPDHVIEAAVFDEIFECIDNKLRENQSIAEIRDSLLPKLMSGEIRVPIEEVQ
ncbi:Restriction modification system DNA specificity domain-containing protein [uncultured Sporomusa sp.]|uniref:Restriction modification system DNA specificity domain-containing protein n=1 Tax=uncultured Sporomusa sp. TaxID=307249 RepID=A0A212LXN7_9FIRM|nr:restriction endonuclease subunit S [uncultured Sporomusa sp.]SCM82364.1 Restriction modification system DNA specificity domain-containing protein [uncultured Sporomusa sp.]